MLTFLDTDCRRSGLIVSLVVMVHAVLLLSLRQPMPAPPSHETPASGIEIRLTTPPAEATTLPMRREPTPARIPTTPPPAVLTRAKPTEQEDQAPRAQTPSSTSTSDNKPVATPGSVLAAATATEGQAMSRDAPPTLSLPRSDAPGLNNPAPTYPRQSRRLNEQGQVVIRVWVNTHGTAEQGEVKHSSGYDRLDQEALRTVLRWHFVPGQRLGAAEAMWFNVPVNFVLN